jgi:CBS domain-containing protein
MSQVRELMTPTPTACRPSTPVDELARVMASQDVGPIPVVDGDELIGIVTDRDLVLRVLAEHRDPRETTAAEIASTDIVTVSPGDDIRLAARLMAEHQVRRLPVVDEGRLVGIVAQADFAREETNELTGRIVEEISTETPSQ